MGARTSGTAGVVGNLLTGVGAVVEVVVVVVVVVVLIVVVVVVVVENG